MNLKDELERKLPGCISSSCQDQGCKLKLDALASDHVIVSGIKYKEVFAVKGNLCDFLVFLANSEGDLKLKIVELKGGTVGTKDFERAHKQLQAGAILADELAQGFNVGGFDAHLVKEAMNPMAARMLVNPKFKVVFRGNTKPIRPLRCGGSLPAS